MIYYGKLLKLFEENGITSYTIKNEKLIGQETLKKLKSGTGIYEEGYDTSNKGEDGKSVKKRLFRGNGGLKTATTPVFISIKRHSTFG